MANKNKDMENLGKVLDAWQQQQNLKTASGVTMNVTRCASVWIDNWRIMQGEPITVADNHKETGWKILYKGQPCIENEVNYEFAYIADDSLLQAAGMNIGDVLQMVGEKTGLKCPQIDPEVRPLSADEYEQYLNKDLRATNKYLEEMEVYGWGYSDIRVNGDKRLPDGTFNINTAAINFDWVRDDTKEIKKAYSIRNAIESDKESENIAGSLLREYDNEYFEQKRHGYNESLPKKRYIPSNFVERNEEKSVNPQEQKKEIKRSRSRESIER